jgi:maltose O-acetyltransferase
MISSSDYFACDSRTNSERMLAGDVYIADDPESRRWTQRAVQPVDAYHQAAIIIRDSEANALAAADPARVLREI